MEGGKRRGGLGGKKGIEKEEKDGENEGREDSKEIEKKEKEGKEEEENKI